MQNDHVVKINMSKSRKKGDGGILGKTLIKEQNRGTRGKTKTNDGWVSTDRKVKRRHFKELAFHDKRSRELHTSDLSDGYEWGRLNLTSVTEESSLDEFLRTAELAGTEFTAEKLHIKVVGDTGTYTGLPYGEEKRDIEKAQQENKQFLSIPRRPPWDETTTPEQLELRERDSFLEWRRHLATLQENEKLTLTPFERNLQFWRQLWRVIEKSDVVVQIVDARNPLLFRCEDLENYVKELDPLKSNMILMNKSDLLTPDQRAAWLEYFSSQNIQVAFWSSKELDEPTRDSDIKEEEEEDEEMEEEKDKKENVDSQLMSVTEKLPKLMVSTEDIQRTNKYLYQSDEEVEEEEEEEETNVIKNETVTESKEEEELKHNKLCVQNLIEKSQISNDEKVSSIVTQPNKERGVVNVWSEELLYQSRLLSREELLETFRKMCCVHDTSSNHPVTIGLVGYPNVGKSSTINALLQEKKVPVSATPGRTKHFQTLYVNNDMILCDCPGLVFPNFVTNKAEMICNGILPIDQMRDHTPPVSMVCHNISRTVLERTYGLKIPPPLEGEDKDRHPYANELLSAYGYIRGFMTSHGLPDQARSARYILKDYVTGRLLYCEPPPGTNPVKFNTQLNISLNNITSRDQDGITDLKETKSQQPSKFDEVFFKQNQGVAHSKGVYGTSGFTRKTGFSHHHASSFEGEGAREKPWKKHNNRKKKEKIRRVVGSTNPYEYY